MKRKLVFTSLLLLITLSVPLSLFSQDFEMDGTMLVRYNGDSANVTIPAGVTAIGGGAFDRCESLTSVTIPAGVTTIGSYAFNGCTSLTSITIPSNVTSIGYLVFQSCTSLTSITVDTQNRTYSSVDGVLFDKNRTVLITYPVAKQGRTYTIPSSVTSIGENAFDNCRSLTSVIIPAGVTSIGIFAFNRCESLTSITIPSSVTSIGDVAFCWCRSLTSITIPSSVTFIGDGAFYACSSLTSIIVDTQNRTYSSVDGVLFDKNKTVIIAYPAGKQERTYTIPLSITSIGNVAFSRCESLTSITIPSSVTSIGEHAFETCTSLTNITIPSSVTSIGDYAFLMCWYLTSVTISRRTIIGEDAFPETARITYSD